MRTYARIVQLVCAAIIAINVHTGDMITVAIWSFILGMYQGAVMLHNDREHRRRRGVD